MRRKAKIDFVASGVWATLIVVVAAAYGGKIDWSRITPTPIPSPGPQPAVVAPSAEMQAIVAPIKTLAATDERSARLIAAHC